MKIKTLSKKWRTLVLSIIMLVTLLCMPAPVLASGTPITGTMWVTHPGTASYFNTYFEGNPSFAFTGWCVDTQNYITPGVHYPVTVYDYFGCYAAGTSMPARITNIGYDNWKKIAWILNHKGSYTPEQIQNAIWHFTNSGPPNALSNAADTSGGMVPGTGEIAPWVCYISAIQLNIIEWQYPYTPPVPELPAGALLGLGVLGLGGFLWFRNRRKSVRI